MGSARAIGLALAALLVSSGPAVAPLEPPEARTDSVWAERAPSEIALACTTPIEAGLLAPDPFAMNLSEPVAAVAPLLRAERVEAVELAAVPEPTALLGLGFGLVGFAAIRRPARALHCG